MYQDVLRISTETNELLSSKLFGQPPGQMKGGSVRITAGTFFHAFYMLMYEVPFIDCPVMWERLLYNKIIFCFDIEVLKSISFAETSTQSSTWPQYDFHFMVCKLP